MTRTTLSRRHLLRLGAALPAAVLATRLRPVPLRTPWPSASTTPTYVFC
jgi:hypothetical protein